MREIEVPAGRPELWPMGDWRPLSREDYRNVLDSLGKRRAEPRQIWIEQAEYAAALADDSLCEGSLVLQIRRRGGKAGFLETGASSLAIADLRWVDGESGERDAVWGRAPAGATSIYVDGGQGLLQGNWTLRGERIGPGIHFDLEVPRANATSLRLRLPADSSLRSSCGVVSGSLTVDDDALREWRVDLGSQAHCQLTVISQAATEMRPVVLAEYETAGVAREDGLHLQTKITLEALNAPTRSVSVVAPRDLDVYSVTHGDLPLTWREAPAAGGKRLHLELPDPLLGKGRSLRVHAIAPIRVGQDWEVPRLTVEDAFFSGSQVHLEIERPLELRDLQLHGSRQVATIARGARGESHTFEEYRPDARVVVRLGRPHLDLTAQVLTHIAALPQEWSFRSEVRWHCVSGATFAAEVAIPTEWDVTEVRESGSQTGGRLLNWDVKRTEARALLVLDFAESFESGEARSVEIFARRRADPASARRIPILLPQPEGARVTEMIVGVTSAAPESLEVRRGESFKLIDGSRVPDGFVETALWSAFEAARTENRSVLLHALNPSPGSEITIERRGPRFRARAHVVVELDGERVVEQFATEIAPQGELVTSVRVYCSTSGPEPAWRIPGEEENVIFARRLPATEHGRWGVPSAGELWEISPASPLRERFTILGARSRKVQPGDDVLLAFVPEAADFEGTLELRALQGRLPEVDARGPQRIDNAAPPAASASAQVWRYQAPADRLQIATLPGSGAARTDRTARLHLASRLSAAGGEDLRHEASFRTGSLRAPARFRFELPASCTLLLATLDGDPVSITRQNSEYVLPPMSPGRPHLVEIHYRSPAADGLLCARQRIPVPVTPFEVLHFQWECTLPREIEFAVAPAGVRLHDSPIGASSSERFFGPLGRPDGAPAFNPLSAGAWSDLLFGPGSQESSRDGWTTRRASAPKSPEVLLFETWNRPRGRIAAWTVLLATLFAGLVLRLYRLPGRTWVASLWLATAFAAAWILPAGWAEIAGAGIAGTLLTLVVPRRLIGPWGRKNPESPSIGSTATVSYGTAGSALVLLFLLHAAAGGYAQDAASSADDGSAGLSVLIPAGSERAHDPAAVVFASRELWERAIKLREEDRRPEYLISSAEYDAEVDSQDSVRLRASYRVAVTRPTQWPRIFLPITGAHLAGTQACRVNGTPHPVLPAPDLSGFVIAPDVVEPNGPDHPPASGSGDPPADAPVDAVTERHWTGAAGGTRRPEAAVRWLDIHLDLRVPVTASRGGGRFEIGIPAVSSARASLAFKRAHAAVEVFGARGRKSVADGGRRVSTELGAVSRLQVAWSSEDRVERSAEFEASITTLIDAQPARLRMTSRVAYRVKRGSIQSLVWEVPKEMVPRSVTLAASEPIAGWFLSPAGENTLHWHIPFSTPKTQDFFVEAVFTLPVRPDGEDVVVLPAIDLLAPHPDRESMAYRQQVGVHSTPLYRVEMQSGPTEPLTSLSAEAFLTEFVRGGGSAMGIEKLRLAYRLQRPTELRFRLTPVTPQRRVWSSQTAHIDPSEIAWTAALEVETNAAPVFRHRLLVDPLLEIDSISVHEDEVDRLERWSRDGESVVLHLSDRTTGVQNVVLKGRMPVQPNGATPLPLVRVTDSELVDSRLHLYRSPAAEVELSGTAEPETLAGPPTPSADRGTMLPLGQYRLAPDKAAPTLVVRPLDGRPVAGSFTIVRPTSDGSLDIEMRIRIRQTAGAARPVRLGLSPALIDLKPVRAQGASYRLETGADGVRTLVVTPAGGASGDPEIALSGLIAPSAAGEWVVPVPSSADASPGEALLVIAAADRIGPVDSGSASVDSRAVPDWVTRSEAFRAAGPSPRVFRAATSEWKIRRQARSAAGPAIALLDTELWLSSGGDAYGTTRLILRPMPDAMPLRLQWPDNIRLRSLAVEGEQPRSLEPRSGVLTVPLDAAPVPQVVTLDWAAPVETRWWPVETAGTRVPAPLEAEVEVSLAGIRAQGRPWLVRQTGFREQPGVQNNLDRLQALVAACRDADPELLHGTAAYAELSRMHRLLSRTASGAGARQLREAERLRDKVLGASAERRPQMVELPLRDGAFLSAGRLEQTGAELTWWTVDRAVLNWGLLLLGLAVTLPVSVWFVRSRPSRWLHSHPSVALVVLGLVWWTCLRPSFVGLAILIAAVVVIGRDRTRQARDDSAALRFE